MTTTTRTTADGSRYEIDALLAPAGWAQLDTDQDASWYGTWAHPDHRTVVTYCEGDITRTHCDTPAEFTAEIQRIAAWHQRMGGWLRIDPCNSDPKAWHELGLAAALA